MTTEELKALLVSLGLRQVTVRNQNIMAQCPFHDDSRPSWGISVNPPHFHSCFSCGAKGALVSLLRYLRCPDAMIKRYSQEVLFSAKSELGWLDESRQEGLKPLSPHVLLSYPPAEKSPRALKYLLGRNLSLRVIRQAGLLLDEEKDRVLIPWVYNGILIGVTGRALDERNPVKMLPYFSTEKSQSFYTPVGFFNRARFILVEGEIDALRLFSLGYPTGALGFGTLSPRALAHFLSEETAYEMELILFFDNDTTGSRLVKKACAMFARRVRRLSTVDWRKIISTNTKQDAANVTSVQARYLISTRIPADSWQDF